MKISTLFRVLFASLLLIIAIGLSSAADAATCTLSSKSATFGSVGSDSLSFHLNATVSTYGTLSYNAYAVPTYYDQYDSVVTSSYEKEVLSGGGQSFPYDFGVTTSPNPKSDIAIQAPAGAVRYTYHYRIHAEVNQNGTVVVQDNWTSAEGDSHTL